jgi:hypothetical protein
MWEGLEEDSSSTVAGGRLQQYRGNAHGSWYFHFGHGTEARNSQK